MQDQDQSPQPLRFVPPPVPAPYLVGIPQLPDELCVSERADLDRNQRRSAARRLQKLQQDLITARRTYEQERGVQIVPEIPLRPSDLPS